MKCGQRPPGRGRRSDLLSVSDAIKEGKTLAEVAQEFPVSYIKFHRGIAQLSSVIRPQRSLPPEVIVIWGPTGTGKSRYVHEASPSVYTGMYSSSGSYWFDGYDGTSDMLFDEFDSTKWNLQFMLRLLDRYPLQVPTKGGFVRLGNAERIFLVSNIPPHQWYAGVDPEVLKALHRRVSKTLHMPALQTVIDVSPVTAMQGTYVPAISVSMDAAGSMDATYSNDQ